MADGRALLEAASRLQPDLIILDSSMPLLNISIKTVQFHKTSLMQDLDRASRLRRALPERLC
ncbi:MAG: hypothetical protein CV089_21885 [Nitrospira sp. WS110]|nr:hypothetical protein [Nitrospira sp. WS110]